MTKLCKTKLDSYLLFFLSLSYHFGVNSTSGFANDLFSLFIEYSLKYESYYGIVRIKNEMKDVF